MRKGILSIAMVGLAVVAVVFASCSRTTLGHGYPGNNNREDRLLAAELSYIFKRFEVKPKDDLRFYGEVASWLGTPYRYGGTDRRGTDCSGFVGAVYADLKMANLKRTVSLIYSRDVRRISRNALHTGDLVFFKLRGQPVSHVGIYLKDGFFIHASSSRGVIVSNIEDDEYYRKNFHKGGRITTGWR